MIGSRGFGTCLAQFEPLREKPNGFSGNPQVIYC